MRIVSTVLAGLLAALLTGCASEEVAPPPPIRENPIPGLVGEIVVDRDVVEVGETLEVSWVLRNRGDKPLVADLAESSPEPGRPWKDFRFDTRHVSDPLQRLDLVPPGPTPLTGLLELAPGDRVEFARARLVATAVGRYRLTAIVEWVGVDVVEFRDLPILVVPERTAGDEGQPGPTSARAEEFREAIDRLASDDPASVEEARHSLLSRGTEAAAALVDRLDDPDERIQSRGLELLLQMGPPVAGLAERGLSDTTRSPETRSRCAYLVATLGGPAAAARLVEAAGEDPAPTVRRMALALLARGKGIDPDRSIPAFIDALEDPDEATRGDAIQYLRLESGQDFGYDPRAPEAQRAAVAGRWREWWASKKR